jgi:protein-disulfide isomerase
MSASPAPADTAPTPGPALRHLPWISVAAAFVAGLAAGYLIWGGSPAPADAPAPVADDTRFEVSADDDAFLGPADAPVTIVEFSDFACGYCRRFHTDTFGELMAAYPGKVRFVYRDFPILSEESFNAAMAAECAADQGDYWGFHHALLEGEGGLGMSRYTAIAASLGMDAAALETCITSNRYSAEVASDRKAGAAAGVTGTPAFFINGLPLFGAQPLSQFRAVIDAELE